MHSFTYHPVGQGLFFSANFTMDTYEQFSIVYDCGTDKKCKHNLISAVNNYKNNYQHIDMLVVSHFDYDHVLGIRNLLAKCTVTKIVLPYLTDEEILMYILEQDDVPYTELEWYISFLINPLSILFQYESIEEILLVLPRDVKGENIWTEGMDINKEELEFEYEFASGKKLKGFVDNKHYTIGYFLKLKFFNYPITKQKEQAFLRKVKDEMVQNNDPTLSAMAHRILSDYQLTLDFKQQYRVINKSNHNNVSLLLMYSYELPIKNITVKVSAESDQLSLFENLDNYETTVYTHPATINHLLTGDISLNYKYKHRKIYEHYKNWLSEVDFIQVPHHGSKHNWNNDLIHEASKNTIFIVSHGINNSFKHPHREVVDSIAIYSKVLFSNQNDTICGSFS